jgi:hypothetical protein
LKKEADASARINAAGSIAKCKFQIANFKFSFCNLQFEIENWAIHLHALRRELSCLFFVRKTPPHHGGSKSSRYKGVKKMSSAEYYYIDKGAKRPLKLLSDTAALRPKEGAKFEQFKKFVERKLVHVGRSS